MTTNNTNLYGKLNVPSCDDLGALESWADAIIDQHRYPDGDQDLARIGEPVCTLFPSADEMEANGGDAIAIAAALESGLDAEVFGQCYSRWLKDDVSAFCTALKEGLCRVAFTKAVKAGLDVETFAVALDCGMLVKHFGRMVEGLDINTLNGALSNFVESTD